MPKETTKQRAVRLSLYQAFSESGQTVTEFSRERGVSYWRVEAALKKTERESGGAFQEVSAPGGLGGGKYTVMLRNGRELRLPAHFSEKRVRQLLEILESC